VDTYARVHSGALTLPTIWSSASAIAAAISFGWRGGVVGALVVGAADFVERGDVTVAAMHNVVIMTLAGTAIGYVSEIGRGAERTLIRAQRLEAATRERQRLARDIHDGVLQVLALVQRRGTELGGDGAELGRMAGEQELALRSLVNSWHAAARDHTSVHHQPDNTGDVGDLDLVALLGKLTCEVGGGNGGAPRVTLSGPGEPVTLPSHAAHELAAAVSAALDNVRAHGGPGADGLGARAWILVEDEPDAVTVTVRDDGPGIAAGRLEEARAAGRLGVAQSIQGRVAEVGGTVGIFSVPGQGTEVEVRVPRVDPVGGAGGTSPRLRRPVH
jgi:signal transduction histidine kinase